MTTFYSTNCPKCRVLKRKLDEKGVHYVVCEDTDRMLSLGIEVVPVLEVDGQMMDFSTAVQWANEQGAE